MMLMDREVEECGKFLGTVSTYDWRQWRNQEIRGCIQKFPDWPPGARTANDPALCHCVQLYLYFL